jgi:hypothetical protein
MPRRTPPYDGLGLRGSGYCRTSGEDLREERRQRRQPLQRRQVAGLGKVDAAGARYALRQQIGPLLDAADVP